MSERDDVDAGPSRRSVLRATVAVSGAAGLAGCSFVLEDDADGAGTPPAADPATGTEEPGTPTETSTPTDVPTPAFDEDCIPLDPASVEVEKFGDGDYRIVEGGSILLAFSEFENAKKSRDIIQFYGFTRQCFVGRPDPPMAYWLADGAPPARAEEAAVESEDCLPVDPASVEVEEFGDDDYRLIEGDSALLLFSDLENAVRARDVIQFYGFTRQCFVGRPDPPMAYWLADGTE